jgi:hypothetical protein
MAVSFASQIRPLFREEDVDAMKDFGPFDLSNHADVSAHADTILERLDAGDMPCDGCWEPDQVALFRQWIDDGKAA